ncbi:hypothetical protein ACSQ67_016003 [Phaseolus vulgaris]
MTWTTCSTTRRTMRGRNGARNPNPLFPLRYHQDGSLADAGGDDEAPYGTSHRIRQAPVWGSPDSGENVVDAFSVMISVCPFDSVADMVAEFAMKWTYVLRTGAVGVRFMGVDPNTLMFNLESIKDLEELKEYVLDQPEAYEIKMGDQFFRRPGDPPLDEVIEKLNSEKTKADNTHTEEIDRNDKTEL